MYYGAKLVKKVNEIRVYKLETPIQLHEDSSNPVDITSVQVYFTNATNVRLTIKVNTNVHRRIFVVVGTIRLLKTLTIDLESGGNESSWDFEHRLKDRSAYGSYIASMSKIVIYDENGKLLYDKMHTFTLSGCYLAVWIVMLLVLISVTLLLSRKFHFG